MKKKIVLCCIPSIIIILLVLIVASQFSIVTFKKYYNEDFDIEDYTSSVDLDNDGVDDQTDILQSVKDYISTSPKYESKYYSTRLS